MNRDVPDWLRRCLRIGAFTVLGGFLGAADGTEIRLAVVGDSLSEGYGLEADEAWPARLEERFRASGKNVRVLNAGVSGATSAAAAARVRWVAKRNPSAIILALGANDGLRGLPVESMEKNLREAVRAAKASGSRVIVAGMKVTPNMGRDYGVRFEAVFPAVAREEGAELLPFLLEGVAAEPSLNQSDRIHPNAEGHRRVAARWMKFFADRPLAPR